MLVLVMDKSASRVCSFPFYALSECSEVGRACVMNSTVALLYIPVYHYLLYVHALK